MPDSNHAVAPQQQQQQQQSQWQPIPSIGHGRASVFDQLRVEEGQKHDTANR